MLLDGNPLESFARETITIDATAGGIGFTSATAFPGRGIGARGALCTLETAQIRFTTDGTAPTTTVGHLLEPGDVLQLDGDEVREFKGIRTGGTSGSMQVTFYR